jgi:hypothetical protein
MLPWGGVAPDTAISGHGTVKGNVRASYDGQPAAASLGTTGKITFEGIVTGNLFRFNTDITGQYRSGFSPTFNAVGGGSTIGSEVFQLLGPEAGSVMGDPPGAFDSQAGDYTQLYGYGGQTSNALPVKGPLKILAYDPTDQENYDKDDPATWYKFSPGETFLLIETGPLMSFLGLLPEAELDMSAFAGFDFSGSEASLPTGTHFEWGIGEALPGRSGLYLTVVPEPSTLILLAVGTLALTFGWWRRRRKS